MELLVTDIANDPKLFVTESGDSKKAYQIGGGFNVPIYYSTNPQLIISSSPYTVYKPSGQSSVYYQNIFTAKTQNFFNKNSLYFNTYNLDYKFSGWNLVYDTWTDLGPDYESYYEHSYVPIGTNTSLSALAKYSVDAYEGGPNSAIKEYNVEAGYTWCWSSRCSAYGGTVNFERNYYDGVNTSCYVTAVQKWSDRIFDHYEWVNRLWPSDSGSGTENPFVMDNNLSKFYVAVFVPK